MPITTQADPGNAIVIHRVSGKVTLDEVCETMESFFVANIARHTLWDLSDADLSKFEPKNMNFMVARFMSHALERAKAGAKTAFFAPQPVNYGICRVVTAISDVLPFARKVFYSHEEALAWLLVGPGAPEGDPAKE